MSTRRRALGAAATALVCGAVVLTAPAAPAAQGARVPPYHPSHLEHVDGADQVIVVTAPSSTTSYATLRAWERDSQGWRQVVEATPARLGWSGLVAAADRRQGTGKTPAGTFGIVDAFGRKANPGTTLDYRAIDRDDAWTYDPRHPRTYNMMQTAPRSWQSYGGYVEHLWGYGMQYDYVAVLDFNLPRGPIRAGADGVRRTSRPADTRAGGGIFLHVSNGKVTAGCIAIPESTMRDVLRWLDPRKDPAIVIGTEASITQM